MMFVSLIENSQKDLKKITNAIWNLSNHFFRKVFDIFEMRDLPGHKLNAFITFIDSLKNIFPDQNYGIMALRRDFKIIVLNAEQKNFCDNLKGFMEEETWTASEFGIIFFNYKDEDFKEQLKESLKVYTSMQIYSKYILIESQKYMMTHSCLHLMKFLLKLKQISDQIGNINEEFFNKATDTIKLFLFNSEKLLINGLALNFNKISRINTKYLSLHILETNFLTLFVTSSFGLNDSTLFDFCVSHKQTFIKKIVEIVTEIIKKHFETFCSLDLNSEEERVMTPSKPTSDVIKALSQVHRAVQDYLLLSDMFSLFKKLEKSIIDKYLLPIKSRVYIKTEIGHQTLVEDLEFIQENCQDLLQKKLNLDISELVNVCKDIENEKTVYIMP